MARSTTSLTWAAEIDESGALVGEFELSYVDPHFQQPHAVGAHVAEGHGRASLRSWACAHADEGGQKATTSTALHPGWWVPCVRGAEAAILIHHGALDKTLSEAYPAQEAELKKNNIRYEGHIYPDSVHGFFNDATPERYNKATAQQAWTRTIEWFDQYVRGPQG
jgi:hypothetical protein